MARGRHQRGGQWIRPAARLAVYLRDEFRCLWCGEAQHETPDQLTLDHYLTRSAGGGNEAGNLVTCCRRCNSLRRELPAPRFARLLRGQGIGPDERSSVRLARVRAQIRRSVSRQLDWARRMLQEAGYERDGSRDLRTIVDSFRDIPTAARMS